MAGEDFRLFRETLSEVWPGLFLSGVPVSYDGFRMVVSCELYQRRSLVKPFAGLLLHVPFEDGDASSLPLGSFESVAEAVVHALKRDERVLLHCTAGLNRSALVMGFVLVRLGMTPLEAIGRMRDARSEWVLCNEAFEKFLLTEGG
jgi:protein-tyrosine phosphatase